jgi:DNA-binding transcriptional LysR family regulator
MPPPRAFALPLASHSLASMDLNLLVAFEALWTERHVTRAGARLGLSQPAMSGALARLREMLGDPLFVRSPSGLRPTERCADLAPPLLDALGRVKQALGQAPFDPATAVRQVTLGAVDAAIAAVVPLVVARVLKEAPKLQLRIVAIDPTRATDLVESGALDLAITARERPSSTVKQRVLFPLHFQRIVRPRHPLTKGTPGEADFARYPRIAIAFHGTTSDAVSVSSFLAMPHLVAASDAWASVPHPFAEQLERSGQVKRVGPPQAEGELKLKLLWPEAQDGAPMSRWLRAHVLAAAKSR